MPNLWQLLLLPFALMVSAILFEANIWCIYGYVTFRESRFTRLPFRILRNTAVVLVFLAVLVPWIVLFRHGLWDADLTWICLSLAVFLFIYAMGFVVEARLEWFFDVERDRIGLREVAQREEEMFARLINEWPQLPAGDRRKFLQTYRSYPLHMREVFFLRLLDTFPIAARTPALEALPHFSAMKMKHWAGAALFNAIEPMLDIRHRLDTNHVFKGPVSSMPVDPQHPVTAGEITVARLGEDEFAIGA